MNAALGFGGVVLGVVGCLGAIVTLAIGLKNHRSDLLRMSRTYAFMILGAAVVSFIAMERALITRDFSLKFVATNGSSTTPALYNFASLWSALEGSILLWTLILAGYTVAVVLKFRKRLSDPLVGWAMLTMFVVALFFFGLMLGPANPFKTLAVPPLETTEELGHPLQVHVAGRVELRGEDAHRLGAVAVGAEPARDERVVVRPD